MSTMSLSVIAKLGKGRHDDCEVLIKRDSDGGLFWPDIVRIGPYSVAIDGHFVADCRLITGRDINDRSVVERICEDPQRFLQRVQNGRFNIVIYDKSARRITICNDRLGLLPLYVYMDETHWICGASLEELARLSPKGGFDRDPVGSAELYWFGYPVGNRTIMKNVSILPASSIVTVCLETGRVQTRTWNREHRESKPRPHADIREAAAQFSETFKQSMARFEHPRCKFALKLSGGMDSRLIAANLRPGSATAFTFGDSKSAEVGIARKIAKKKDFPFHFLDMPENMSVDPYIRMSKNHGLMEFFHDQIANQIRSQDCNVALDGLAGDVLAGGLFLKSAGSRLNRLVDHGGVRGADRRNDHRVSLSSNHMAKKIFESVLVDDRNFKVLNPETHCELEKLHLDILDDISAQIEGYRDSSENEASVLAQFKFANRTRRYIAMQALSSRPSIETLFPFLDNDVQDFLTTLPGDLMANKRLYLEVFTRQFADLRPIPPIMSLLPFYVRPIQLHYLGRVLRYGFDRLSTSVAIATRGHVSLKTMEATQWRRWFCEEPKIRSVIWELMNDSGVVETKSLLRCLEEWQAGKNLPKSGTRVMLSASYASLYGRLE